MIIRAFQPGYKWYVPYTMGALVYTWTVRYTLTAYSPGTHLNALFSK